MTLIDGFVFRSDFVRDVFVFVVSQWLCLLPDSAVDCLSDIPLSSFVYFRFSLPLSVAFHCLSAPRHLSPLSVHLYLSPSSVSISSPSCLSLSASACTSISICPHDCTFAHLSHFPSQIPLCVSGSDNLSWGGSVG